MNIKRKMATGRFGPTRTNCVFNILREVGAKREKKNCVVKIPSKFMQL